MIWIIAGQNKLADRFSQWKSYLFPLCKCEQVIYPRSAYVTFDRRGVWNPAIKVNQKVKKGDLLGTLTDFFGNEIKKYYADYDGTIIYYIAGMCILEGDEAIAYGIDE